MPAPSSRRHFITGLSAAAAAGPGFLRAQKGKGGGDGGGWQIAAFEKSFQKLTYDEIGKLFAGLGFDGIEATVRPGGHIPPEQAVDKLPAAVEALKKHDQEIILMASGINAVNPLNEQILRTAAKLGIKRYRLSYFRYEKDQPVRKQIREIRARVADVAAMNKALGIQGVYQNHAGPQYVGASLWDLAEILEGIDSKELGVALDTRHSRVESGLAWKTTYRVIRPHVVMVFAKDSRWEGTKAPVVPLGTGIVSKEVFQEAVRGNAPLPVCLHVEYFGHKPLDPGQLEPVIAAHRRDLAILKGWM